MKYSVVLDRLQNLINDIPSQSDLCSICGVKQSAMSNRAKLDSSFKPDEIEKINKYYGINLFTNTLETYITNSSQDDIILDYYPEVFGSCGTGVFELSQTKEQLIVPKKAFFTRFSSNKKYSVINAYGNSMQPFIFDKDKLIVEHWEGEQIIDNRPYVFCYNNEIFIKRLAKNVNQLIISSDNKDYDKIILTKDDLNRVQVIGQIVGLMRDLR